MKFNEINTYRTSERASQTFNKIEIPLLETAHIIGTIPTLPEVLFITSFPPRECGIATYSQDLIHALENQFEQTLQCSICALESDNEQHTYSHSPKYVLNTDQRDSFMRIASEINNDTEVKVVVMQHEFGFFAKWEVEFSIFFNTLRKPIIFVFHTVLPFPNKEMKAKVQDMTTIASSIIVMTNNAACILQKDYDVPANIIKVIPHGTHLVQPVIPENIKKSYNLSDKKILSTFGFLSAGKGIETTLDALPDIIKIYPDVIFLILGKTHPAILHTEGEKYRQMLKNKAEALNIQNHIQFVNEYLPLHKLVEYLQMTDIYLFTSKDPNQAVSGTFSYALSCGCPVISTPIPHAKEVLNSHNGIIIDFNNSSQLSKSVISLLEDADEREILSTNNCLNTASTSWQNSAISHMYLFDTLVPDAFHIHYRIPDINFDHLKRMTTNFGIIQFAKYVSPDLHSGYTLDDNARALIVMCQHFKKTLEQAHIPFIRIYLHFVEYCLQSNGYFLNYVNLQHQFTPNNYSENLDDSNGRAVWALGYVISLKGYLPDDITDTAERIFARITPHFCDIYSTRAMAFIIKGLYYQNNQENLPLLQEIANRLLQMYNYVKTDNWHWFENYLTYANSVLPEAMLCAYNRTKNITYKNVAKDSFDFLLSKTFIDGRIKVISNKGWLLKDSKNIQPLGGEQPIDVSYTIIALEEFYKVFHEERYKDNLRTAFNWFLGNNHLHQIIYNPCTGGCYDGIEEHNLNLNQGAESTLSFLLAHLSVNRVYNRIDEPVL
jgi:glycosyltransferase involved in cell wall biosynthesis